MYTTAAAQLYYPSPLWLSTTENQVSIFFCPEVHIKLNPELHICLSKELRVPILSCVSVTCKCVAWKRVQKAVQGKVEYDHRYKILRIIQTPRVIILCILCTAILLNLNHTVLLNLSSSCSVIFQP